MYVVKCMLENVDVLFMVLNEWFEMHGVKFLVKNLWCKMYGIVVHNFFVFWNENSRFFMKILLHSPKER